MAEHIVNFKLGSYHFKKKYKPRKNATIRIETISLYQNEYQQNKCYFCSIIQSTWFVIHSDNTTAPNSSMQKI